MMASGCSGCGGEVIMGTPVVEGEIMGEVIHEEVVAPVSSSDAPVEAAPVEAAPAEAGPCRSCSSGPEAGRSD